MVDTKTALETRLQAAFDSVEAGADPVLRPSDHADFQANGALPLAKRLGRPPKELAEQLVAAASLDDLCEKVEVSGPGFINLTLSAPFIASQLADLSADARLGVPTVASADGGRRLLGPERGQGDARRPSPGDGHR